MTDEASFHSVPSTILSIRELIDAAFGEANINVVNHKLIQTILIILAKQLRVLERRVEVEIGPMLLEPSTSLSVTEVKLRANVPRRRKGRAISEGRMRAKDTPKSISTSAGKSAIERSTSDKSSTEKSSSVMTSSGTKTSTEPSSSLRTSTGKSSSFKTSSEEKSSTDRTMSSSDKTSSDKTYSEKTFTGKASSEKTAEEKPTSDKATTKKGLKEDKSSSGKTGDRMTAIEESSSEKISTDMRSSEIAKEKKTGIQESSSQNYATIRETIEQMRERELRVIRQRVDSREENYKTPTPMASLDSMEKQFEKLLVVERVPKGEIAESRSQTGVPKRKTSRLSIVTQEEFESLAEAVRQLQAKFGSIGTSAFPENAQLLNDLRKGASLTDAMAALQLSARVESAEKALEKMLGLVTELARNTPGVNLDEKVITKSQGTVMGDQKTEVLFGSPGAQSEISVSAKKKSLAAKEIASKSKKSISTKTSASKESMSELPSDRQLDVVDQETNIPKDSITYEELDNVLQEMYDEFMKVVNTSTSRSNANSNNALKIANRLEGKLDEVLDLGDRMLDLEKLISDYAEQINTLDTGLSSQMTNYQEHLTQMQHDLESGLETMAEAMANTGGDTAAVAELNNHFTCLQNDIDIALSRQKELKDIQDALSFDLQSLWKQIEILRGTKSDRDEVADALRDKAGLAALNGLVSRQEFDAVRGDFEKQIGAAYDKFNNQEVVWQKAIDDLLRELSEKADWIQLVSLQSSINEYLEKLRNKIQAMSEVVGEPRAAAITRRLHRDAECLSCATPAHMELEMKDGPHELPRFTSSRPPAVGAEAEAIPQEDGDHRVCYPGLAVPHAVDPRAHVCHRYCGGSHTVINNTISRAPVGMIINPALRKVSTALGTDGKLYMVDEERVTKPCVPCNLKSTTAPEPSEAEPVLRKGSLSIGAPIPDNHSSDMTPPDFHFQASMQELESGADKLSLTPPPPIDDD